MECLSYKNRNKEKKRKKDGVHVYKNIWPDWVVTVEIFWMALTRAAVRKSVFFRAAVARVSSQAPIMVSSRPE